MKRHQHVPSYSVASGESYTYLGVLYPVIESHGKCGCGIELTNRIAYFPNKIEAVWFAGLAAMAKAPSTAIQFQGDGETLTGQIESANFSDGRFIGYSVFVHQEHCTYGGVFYEDGVWLMRSLLVN